MAKLSSLKNCISQAVVELSKSLVEDISSHEMQHDSALQSHKVQADLEQHVQLLQDAIQKGLTACLEGLEQAPALDLSIEQVLKELKKGMSLIKTEVDLAEFGQNLLMEKSAKMQLGISNTCMEALYQGAATLFETKEYRRAEQAFFFICTIDPTQYAFWVGLGHASFQEQNYPQAIRAYSMASGIDHSNVWPHIWAANCFEKENETQYAKLALEEALSLQSTDQEVTRFIQKRIQDLKREG